MSDTTTIDLTGGAGKYEQPVEDAAGLSDLAILAADLAEPDPDSDVERFIPVETRPGYKIEFSDDVSGKEIEGWRKAAGRGKKSIDDVKLVALCVANKTVGIYKNGERLEDEDGDPITFRHKQFLDLLRVTTAADAVVKFFAKEGLVDAAAKTIMRASGWGTEVAADPTAAD